MTAAASTNSTTSSASTSPSSAERRRAARATSEEREADERAAPRARAPFIGVRESRPRRLGEADRFRHGVEPIRQRRVQCAAGRGVWTFVRRSARARRTAVRRSDRPRRAGCAAPSNRAGCAALTLCRVGRPALHLSLEEEPSCISQLAGVPSLSAAAAALAAAALLAAPAAAAAGRRRRRLPRRADRPAVRAVAATSPTTSSPPTATSRQGGASWQLAGGAGVVEGNEPFHVGAPADQPVAAAARRQLGDDRAVLHRRRAPHDALLRHERRASSTLDVESLYTDARGTAAARRASAPSAAPAPGRRATSCRWSSTSWPPTHGNAMRVRLRFTAARQRRRGRSTTCYVDPYRMQVARSRRATGGAGRRGRLRSSARCPAPCASCARS